jgi:lysophospholipase L1-like esterase
VVLTAHDSALKDATVTDPVAPKTPPYRRPSRIVSSRRAARVEGGWGLAVVGNTAARTKEVFGGAALAARRVRSVVSSSSSSSSSSLSSSPTDDEHLEPASDAEPSTARRLVTWKGALGAGLTCFAIWLLLDAPTLYRSAQAAPLGARRTVAMDLLAPVRDVSDALGLSHVVGAADRVLGRNGTGVVQVVGPPMSQKDLKPTAHDGARGASSATQGSDGERALAPGGLPSLPVPTPANPLRVLSVGDSLGVDFGETFVNDLATTGVVSAALDAHVDTGLSRPDYFNWPLELEADLARYKPEVVVVFLGANDPQNFVDGQGALAFGTPAWDAAYAKRVGALMQAATSSGARVLWVGMPPMADPLLNLKMVLLDRIYQAEARKVPGASYLSSWPVLSEPNGDFASYLPDPSGNEVQVREPDGTHMSPSGAERLSRAVFADMDQLWGLRLVP